MVIFSPNYARAAHCCCASAARSSFFITSVRLHHSTTTAQSESGNPSLLTFQSGYTTRWQEYNIDIYKMAKSAADKKILSYNDVVLRKSDLDILSGEDFLNDRIIEFYFSYLSSCYPSENILLVPPSIAFWITNCPDIESLNDFLEPLNLPTKKLVIFPVNNNNDVTKAEGGSHWSLLVFERDANVFVHHDSYGGLNAGHAKQLYKAIVGYMGIANTASTCKYLECYKTPQQVNGYDCGLYVAAIGRAICSWYESGGPKDEDGLWFCAVNEKVTSFVIAGMRSEVLTLIRSLMAIE